MFARMLEFSPKWEKKEEFIKTVKNEVLPILKKQTGFLEILPFFPETKNGSASTSPCGRRSGMPSAMSAKRSPRFRKSCNPISPLHPPGSCTRSRPPCVSTL